MARIAIVHVPFYSHIQAARRLTRVLVRQGHEVIAWAPESWRGEIESDGTRFHVHEPRMPESIGFVCFVADLAETTEQLTGPLVEELFAEDVDLVVHDSQVPWARVAGDFLGLPRIVTHPMFPIVSPDHLPNDDEEPEDENEDTEEAQRLFDARWLSIAGTWGVELGELDTVIHTAGASDATVAFTTEEILGDWELEDGWNCIGPLMDEPPPPPVPNGERPLVYVCLGTSFNARRAVFRAAIDGLADEPVDVLISTGKGRFSTEDFEPLPANVEVRDFVPTREVLARARLHVTHGGCNSVHESLLAGVPMLLVPQAFDQFPLAQRIERLGAGLIVEETPAAVRAGARWLVEDEVVHARTRELGDHLASYDGQGRVAAVVARALAGNPALSA